MKRTSVSNNGLHEIYQCFYNLVQNSEQRTQRKCLKCNHQFSSSHHGNRICNSCAEKNLRISVRALQT